MTKIRALVLLLLLLLGASTPAWAARSFNGVSDYLVSASQLNINSTQITVSFWLWWDAYPPTTDNNDLALEFYDGTGTYANVITVNPNEPGSGGFETTLGGNVGLAARYIDRADAPAGQWNHVVINYDLTATGAAEVAAVIINGASKTLSTLLNNDNATFNGTWFLNVMRRGDGSLFGAGRIAELAIWTGINLSCCAGGTDVSNLYNGGSGSAATNIQNGNLTWYWKICGANSPEPASKGAVDLTVGSGTTQVTHPINTCAASTVKQRRRIIHQ